MEMNNWKNHEKNKYEDPRKYHYNFLGELRIKYANYLSSLDYLNPPTPSFFAFVFAL
jgi:hypothetical protein